MTDKNLAPYVRIREFDANGAPLAGGKLYTYRSGTSTAKATYSDAGGTLNANPIILDSEGSADIWIDDDEPYRFRLESSSGSLRWQRDNVTNAGGTVLRSLTNIAALKLVSGSATSTTIASVAGYYSAGDGGGGEFWWDSASTATDNGGTIIKATSVTTGRWKRITDGFLNVLWFGAKGDGTTDDSAAFTAAIALANTSGGICIDIPMDNRTYAVNISIANKRGIKLRGTNTSQLIKSSGSNSNTACLIPYDVNTPVIIIGDNTGVSANALTSGITLDSIKLDGRASGKYGIKILGGSYRNYFYNVHVSSFTTIGVWVVPAAGKRIYYTYFDGYSVECTTTASKGIFVDSSLGDVTSLYLHNGLVYTWSDTSSRGIVCDSAAMSISNTYIQLTGSGGSPGGYGIELLATRKAPDVWCSMLNIDGDTANNDVAVYVNIAGFSIAGANRVLSTYIHGSFACDGYVRDVVGTNYDATVGAFAWEDKPVSYNPATVGAHYFANNAYPGARTVYMSVGGGAAPTVLRAYVPGTFEVRYDDAFSSPVYLEMNGTQVLTTQRTGWTAPTGTLSRATFDQSTVTLPELAKRLAALITDLQAHGLINP